VSHLESQSLVKVDNASSHFYDQFNTCELNEPIELNSDFDEKTSNDSELEVTAISRKNHQG
ncbi:2669_t:CDS:1, partial [Dentiscutata heterogama]